MSILQARQRDLDDQPRDRGEIFEDTTVAAEILDRLLHHATVLQIDGDSYRVRGHRARLQQLRHAIAAEPETKP